MNNREKALEYAIKANLQAKRNEDGNFIEDVNQLIEATKKIENYLEYNDNESEKNNVT